MKISIIAAMAKNRVIGRENKLPWHLPADLKRFKKLTMGRYLIMGRKTFESLKTPLPNRTSIIVTRQEDYKAKGCLIAHSLKEAIKLAENEREVFIIGGAQIYEQSLPLADRMYLTLIHRDLEGDVYFPEFNKENWRLVSREDHHHYSFLVYDKVKMGGLC